MRVEGLRQLKNLMPSPVIEPATFRLVALCLNQLRYRVPSTRMKYKIIALCTKMFTVSATYCAMLKVKSKVVPVLAVSFRVYMYVLPANATWFDESH
jgi:hypothetical protein